MILKELELFTVTLPARIDHRWPGLASPVGQNHVVARIEASEGLVGWGEVPPIITWGGENGRYYGEDATTVRHIVTNYLWPAIRHKDAANINAIHSRLDGSVRGHPYAKALIDIAIHDLKGRALGVPIHQLLGGQVRDRIRMGYSVGLKDTQTAVSEARDAVQDGLSAIKLKVGIEPTRGIEVVAAVREAIGPDVTLWVDANQAWDVPTAVRVLRAIEPYDVMYAEQPVQGLEAMRSVASQVGIPLLADESLWNAKDVIALRAAQAADYGSIYVPKAGGLLRGWQVGTVMEAAQMTGNIGGSAEFGIANAANLHLAAALPALTIPAIIPITSVSGKEQTRVAGRRFTDDIVKVAPTYEDGYVYVPDGPGLGIDVDVEKLEQYGTSRVELR